MQLFHKILLSLALPLQSRAYTSMTSISTSAFISRILSQSSLPKHSIPSFGTKQTTRPFATGKIYNMPMKLQGSCQCGGVQFSLDSQTPVPYQLCACSICRKVGGYSGSVNLGGIADSLDISRGKELIKKYSAIKERSTPHETRCSSERNFCSTCSTMLWLWDHHFPELIHPFASAIDSDLPVPKEMVCIMGGSKPAWVRWPEGSKSTHETYGEDSLEGWHKKNNLFYS